MAQLSTFIAAVIGDATDGVRAAATGAETRRQELREARTSDPSEVVEPATVDAVLRERCPRLDQPAVGLVSDAGADRTAAFRAAWQSSETAVRAGNVYVDPWRGDDQLPEEFPPIRREFGVELHGDDLETVGGVRFLTEQAVERVRSAIADRVGRRRLDAIDGVVRRGTPRVGVESVDVSVPTAFGRTNGRLTARAVPATQATPAGTGRVGVRLAYDRR